MQTLLIIAVVLIALAVIVQAGVLVALYMLSRKLADRAETLMNESHKILKPMEAITANLKSVADDLAVTGKMAREQVLAIQGFISETEHSIRGQIADVRGVVMDTMSEARGVVMRPLHHYAAIATGIAEGIRTFLFGRKEKIETAPASFEEKHPAA